MDGSRRVADQTGMARLTLGNPNRPPGAPLGSGIGSDKELIRATHRRIVGTSTPPNSAIGSSGLTTAERGTFPLQRASRRFWKTLRTELHTPALHRQRGATSGSDTRKTHDEE